MTRKKEVLHWQREMEGKCGIVLAWCGGVDWGGLLRKGTLWLDIELCQLCSIRTIKRFWRGESRHGGEWQSWFQGVVGVRGVRHEYFVYCGSILAPTENGSWD